MLLFIYVCLLISFYYLHFNTSHVTVYPFHNRTLHLLYLISIHLMLLFIAAASGEDLATTSFQYISCYCLSYTYLTPNIFLKFISIHLMLLFIGSTGAFYYQLEYLFQYISCYCLSAIEDDATDAESTFQYISCYCLSLGAQHQNGNLTDFNTSHVTVYRSIIITGIICDIISIHLMLLFIFYLSVYAIQYCYFNTSHVTVYRSTDLMQKIQKGFQYISCYCLS